MSKIIWSVFLFFSFCFSVSSQETGSTESFKQIPFTTIEHGQASQFSRENPQVQPVFKDPETWKSFWEAYTKGRKPRPVMPYVDFNSEMVIVSSLGEVSGVYVDRNHGLIRVVTGDITRPDYSPETTTPFHIITTEKLQFQSIAFTHPNPTKNLAIGEETREGADFNAAATPDIQTQDLSVAETAPNCVSLDQWDSWDWWKGWKSHARAINSCGYGVRFRMIWAWAGDGGCHTIYRSWYEERSGKGPYVSELRSC